MRRALLIVPLLMAGLAPPVAAERLIPCVPHEAVDGRCEAWASTHDGAADFDAVRAVTTTPDGWLVISAGETQTAEGRRILTTIHDAAGADVRWTRMDGRPGDAYDMASAVATDGSAVYVAGAACEVITDGSTCDAALVARDVATGGLLWSVFRDGGGLDSAQDVVVDDGVVYLGGQTFAPGREVDYLVAAFDAATGQELWAATYDGPPHGPDRGADLVQAGDLLVLTGKSAGPVDDDIVTVAFDTTEDHEGEIAWIARFSGPGADEAYALDAAGGHVVVAGKSVREAITPDPVVLAYDAATGDDMWLHRYADPGIAAGELFDVAIAPDGSKAVATGYTQRSDGKGPSTLGFDVTTGQRLWAVNLQEGLGYAAGVSPDGSRAYVTGGTYTRRGVMHRTISYAMGTGVQRWAGLYEHTAPPAPVNNTLILPSALAVSPDGTHVYVGGATRPLGAQHDDALTLAYQA